MKKIAPFFLLLNLFFCNTKIAQSQAAYLRSTIGQPWNNSTNESAMDDVLGNGNWSDLRFETVDINNLLSNHCMLFLEGGDIGAIELENFLTTNIASIENWVNNGGNLFLNSAPNEGNGMSFGFGGTNLVYGPNLIPMGSSNGSHAIFNGPFLPVATSWSGNYFAHAIITGSFNPLILDISNSSNVVLGIKQWGAGQVIFGGLTTVNFHSPSPHATNLRRNILAFLNLSIVCPADAIVNCAADIIVDVSLPMTSSCVQNITVTAGGPNLISGNADCPGAKYEVIYTVQDGINPSASCTQTFTIENTAPTIICPADMTVFCETDIIVDVTLPLTTSSCSLGTIVSAVGPNLVTGIVDCPGAIYEVIYTVTDACSRTAMCTQTFTIENTAPTISCPADMTVFCETDIIVDVALPLRTSSCSLGTIVSAVGPNLITGIADCPGAIYEVIYTVTDACSRTAVCTQTFTIENTGPTISCPADMTVFCETDIIVDVTLPLRTSSCVAGTVTAVGPTRISGEADCPGAMYEVIYMVTDICNRTAVCTQTFTIQNGGPLVSCPTDVIVACSDEIVVEESDVVVSTACSLGFTVEITGPNVLGGLPNCPASRYRYYYTVTDDCGRAAICFREFIIENDPPTINCSPNEIVECAADIIIDDSEVTVSTNCNLQPTITTTTTINGLPDCPGSVYIISYTVSDQCGRSASCDKTWTIQNADPEILKCAPDRVVECSFDILAEPEEVLFTVSCDQEYMLNSGPVIALDDLGDCPGATYSITYTLTDACDRETDCTQSFTIDNRPPRVFPEEDQYVACREDIAPSWENCMVETDCNMGIIRYEIIGPIEEETEPDCNGKIINYLYSVWDACERMTCVAQAWIIKNEGPTFDHEPIDITVECGRVPDGSEVTASFEGCGNVVVLIEDEISSLPGMDYQIKRTFIAEDDCGNSVITEQNITVICNRPEDNGEGLLDGEVRLSLWPNPARDRIDLEYRIFQKNAINIRIFNTSGILMDVVSTTVDGGLHQEKIDISSWPKGIYFVAINIGKEDRIKRFIKL